MAEKHRSLILVAILLIAGFAVSEILKGHDLKVSVQMARADDLSDEPVTNAAGDGDEVTGDGSPDGTKDGFTNTTPTDNTITDVTVYSDRALVTRTAPVKLKKGAQWIHFASLPEKIDRTTLKLSQSKGLNSKISQFLVRRSYEHKTPSGDVMKRVAELRRLYGQFLSLTQQQYQLGEVDQFIKSINFNEPFSSESYQPYLPFSAKVETLKSSMDEIQQQSSSVAGQLNKLERQIQEVQFQITAKEGELSIATNTTDQRWVTHVYCLLDTPQASSGSVHLSYMISGALWHPVYDLRTELDRDTGKARIKVVTAGLVEQKTGEDWKNVKLKLSTLDPIPLYLPKLWRWTLDEHRQEEPKALAKKMPIRQREEKEEFARSAPADAPPADMAMDEETGAAAGEPQAAEAPADALDDKSEMAAQAAPPAAPALAAAPSMNRAKTAGIMDYGGGSGASHSANKTKAGGAEREPAGNLFPLDSLEDLYPNLANLTQKARSFAPASATQDVALSGSAQPHQLTDSSLPAVQAQGRIIELGSPFPVDIRSDEPAYKVPVHTEELLGDIDYFTVPKKDSRAFLRAKTTNTTKLPLLGGEAQVFMDGDLVSKTNISTVDDSSYFDVNLGVDRNVEIKRIVKKIEGDKGLLSTKHVTRVNVEIDVVNHHAFPVSIEVNDNIPVSPHEDIVVAAEDITPAVTLEEGSDSADIKTNGLLRWRLKIPPGEKKTVMFNYKVTHPENFILSEMN